MIFSLTRSPPSVKQDRIHHPSVSSTYRATYSGENMAPSRSTPRMMQMTRAAFQAVVSLNEQATDPKSHTLVRITYTLSSPVLSPANSDGRPRPLPVRLRKDKSIEPQDLRDDTARHITRRPDEDGWDGRNVQ